MGDIVSIKRDSVPLWQKDEDPNATACGIFDVHRTPCGKKFGFWTRRHHCRACGLVICGDCSNMKKITVPAEGKTGFWSMWWGTGAGSSPSVKSKRVCDECSRKIRDFVSYVNTAMHGNRKSEDKACIS